MESSSLVPVEAVTRRPRPRWHRHAIGMAVLAGFVGASLELSRTLIAHPGARQYGGQDPMIFLWWLRWVPYAISHGLSPLHSDWLNYPYGVNGLWNTSMLLLGLVCTPLTLTIGPLATFNVLLTLAPALSGWACYLVARRLFAHTLPAVIAGLLYGFSPYMVGQTAGHLQLTWALFPPVFLLLCVELLRDQRPRPWLLGLAMGTAVSLQLWTGEELLASAAIVAAMTTLILVAIYPDEALRRFRYAAVALACGAGSALVLTGPALAEQFLGRNAIKGPVQHNLPGADLLAPFVPTHLQALHFASASLINRVDGTNLSEQTSYLGLPLIALLIGAAFALRRTRHLWYAVPLLISFVLMLGPHLVLAGHDTHLPLPWIVLRRLPVVSSIIPVRLCLYVFLFGGLLLGAWLDTRITQARADGRRLRSGLPAWTPSAALIGLALLPVVPIAPLRALPISRPAFFGSAADLARLPAGSVVLVTPYASPSTAQAMWWQADAAMRFKMPGGYFLAPNELGDAAFGRASGPTAAIIRDIARGLRPPTPDAPRLAEARAELASRPYDAIIVGPMHYQLSAARFVKDLTGVHGDLLDGVWLFRLPK
ncbi:MAG: hypothetical protein M3N21_06455 [Actinomycetota bacterium]|nr:hypothetical protein [Actinomycetota bacterium]